MLIVAYSTRLTAGVHQRPPTKPGRLTPGEEIIQ
jgi:hypothetical protein